MLTTLTKMRLIDRLSKTQAIKKKQAAEIIDAFFGMIKTTLASGENVKLSGFGNFVLLDKKARMGRNPKTGEEKLISARRVVTFRPGHKLKTRVKQRVHDVKKDNTNF